MMMMTDLPTKIGISKVFIPRFDAVYSSNLNDHLIFEKKPKSIILGNLNLPLGYHTTTVHCIKPWYKNLGNTNFRW
jgi:hypothetical protein